jgi:exopolysaccharide biosynthesis polyprenyl glycosylphosphotransferase
MDIVFCSMALIIFFIPMALIALLIKLESRGPIFYKQERVGLDGKIFKMWKFRSMRQDAERSTGAVWAIENDPRRTKFGCFLRRTSLDELPQLWNVLKGEMSMVGPRPERPIFVRAFEREYPLYAHRHQVKVGITGWAQVHGWRGQTSIQSRLDCDLYYLKNWSPWIDIRVLFLTIFRGFVNKNAY